MTEIFAVELTREDVFYRMKADMLARVPETTRRKIESYVHYTDAQRSLLGELMARHLLQRFTGASLPEHSFTTGDKGKPEPEGFNGIHFNISHSGNWVVVAVSDVAVGVDVEKIRKVPEGVANRFFSESEKKMLNDAGDDETKADIFFTLWTLKESFLKAIGKGLTKSLSSFSVIRTGDHEYTLTNDSEAEGFHLKTYEFSDGYKLAACAAGKHFSKKATIVTIGELTAGSNPLH